MTQLCVCLTLHWVLTNIYDKKGWLWHDNRYLAVNNPTTHTVFILTVLFFNVLTNLPQLHHTSHQSCWCWFIWKARSLFRSINHTRLIHPSLCVYSCNVIVFAIWGLIIWNWGCVAGTLMLEREQISIWFDSCFVKIFWFNLQLFQRLPLGLHRLLNNSHFSLVLGVFISGPLFQKQGSALTLFKWQFRSLSDPEAQRMKFINCLFWGKNFYKTYATSKTFNFNF